MCMEKVFKNSHRMQVYKIASNECIEDFLLHTSTTQFCTSMSNRFAKFQIMYDSF